jgi:uncharacterized iron-regulated membrane protein
MPTQASFLKMIRQAHLYLGTFIAPAILFFAFTGALQTFSLHQYAKGSAYKPANWIVELAEIHKRQIAQVPPPKPQPSASSETGPHNKPEKSASPLQTIEQPAHNPLPLKIFFLIVCVGLFTSTFSGLYMSYKYSRKKLLVATLFLAGIVVPILLTRI